MFTTLSYCARMSSSCASKAGIINWDFFIAHGSADLDQQKLCETS